MEMVGRPLAGAGAIVYWTAHGPLPGGHHEIVVADFLNPRKYLAFDVTLRNALEIELGQSPYLSVLPQPKIGEALRMGRQADGSLSEPVAREVCQRNGGQVVIASAGFCRPIK